MSQVVSLLTIDARGAEVGSATYVRAMKVAQAAVDRLADAEERAKAAQAGQTLVMTGNANSIARTAAQWDKLRASLDPVIAATKAIEQAQLRADAAVRRGVTTQEEAARIVAQVRKKHADALGVSNDNAPSGLAKHEIINLSRQAQDVFVSLSSGQNPLTVLIQQGSQIADIFASSNATVGSFLRQLLGWLGPLAPALAASAAAASALFAAFSVGSERSDVAASLRGIGRTAGITGGELNRLAKDAAEAAGVTVSAARSMAAEFTRTGKIAPEMTSRLIKLAKDYAFTTGQELEPAVKELAEAFADPIKGAEALNQRLGFLDGTMQTAIRRSVDMGDRLRAQRLLTDGMAASVIKAEEAQSSWNRAWEKYITLPIGRAKEAVGSALLPADQQTKLDDLTRQLRDNESRLARVRAEGLSSSPEKDRLEARVGYLNEQKRALESLMKVESDRAELSGRLATNNAKSREAESLFANANREIRDAEKLNAAISTYENGLDAIKKKREALGGDGARNASSLDDENFRNFTAGLARAKAALKDYSSVQQGATMEQDKTRRLSELDARAINDVTVAQKAATAAERVRIELRGTENSAAERSRMAEEARQRVLTEGKALAVDQRRASQDNVDALNAETDAIKSNGVAAAEIAKLKAQAQREVRGTNEDAGVRFQELLQEASAKVNREIAEQNSRLREQVQIGRDVNDRAARQNLSEQQIYELLQRQSDIQARINQLRAIGADEGTILRAQRDLIALKEQELTIDQRRRALGMINGQSDQIQGLELEISLIGRNAEERNRLIAIMRAEQELRRQGIPLTSEEGQAYVDNAARIAGLNTVKERLSEIQDIGKDALKGFVSDLRNGKSATEALTNSLNRVADKLLDIASDQAISSLFGSKGSAGGGLLGSLLKGFGFGGGGNPFAEGAGGYSGFGPFLPSAKGNVFAGGNVIPFARGGVIDRPMTFPLRNGMTGLAGEAGAEAIMPLRRNSSGQLGVVAAGGGGGGRSSVTVNVINQTDGKVTQESRKGPDGSEILDIVIQKVAGDMSTPGSATHRALRSNYGAQQQLTKR
ncbi:Phage-related minor tail protein [Bosea sp. LC85]|uniref:phage tail length tape measure family protein n=1 Tax=Bosea sp. LC85 TaxID=1502851 RepID=UPI0004E3DB40|nr:phage tail length tape measure family protein [Bosea sp. LC85]KFC73193.1 Phage-related minor tail protein [Bosea sp. LC85]